MQHDVSFAELSHGLCECVNKMHKMQNPSLPKCVAYAFGLAGDAVGRLTKKKKLFDSHTFKKMTSDLTFSCDKAMKDFNWTPTPVLNRLEDLFSE